MKNQKIVLLSVVVLILLFIGGGYAYKKNEADKMAAIAKERAALFQRDYSLVIGNPDAKVQLVEFFDPACGTCAAFHSHVKEIMKQNEGKIKLVLRYAPYHQNSVYAVKMLEGAREQGKFNETIEMMYATQAYWINNHVVNPDALWSILYKVQGLDMQKLADSIRENKYDTLIEQDLADAKELNANKTPSFYVNGKPLQTFGLQQLKDLINSEL